MVRCIRRRGIGAGTLTPDGMGRVMGDIVVYLLGTACTLGVLGLVVVLPIIAIVRSRRVVELSRRLDELDGEVRRLRRLVRKRAGAEAPAAEPEPEPAEREAVTEAEPVEVVPAEPPRRRRLPLPRPPDAVSLEDWIGRRGLGWAAVVLLLFATAFFLKYAFENDWVGPLGRVSIGIVAGAALCVGGWRAHRRGYRLFSQMLTAAGIVLLYLASFAAFGYYRLMPRDRAALFLVVLVGEAAALALLYDAMAIALMAVVGGLLTPLLLRTDHDQYQSLFAYLIVLNLGVVALALFRSWRAVATVALAGTQALFWAWWYENYHPEKLVPALLFQATLFTLFLAQHVFAHVVRKRNADVEALARTVLNAFLFALAGYVLLRDNYRVWLGTAAVGLAIVYTALGWVVLRRRPGDTWQQLVVVATALGFVAVVFPLQASAAWVALGWAVEGAALSWFGLRVRSDRLRGLGAALLVLGAGRLFFVDTLSLDRTEPFVPIFNRYALPALAVAACLLFAAAASRHFLKRPRDIDRVARVVAALAGVLLVWLVLSIETYQTFTTTLPLSGDADRFARTSLSVLWPVYAAVLLAVGFKVDSAALRWTGLALFALTLGKVVLVDMSDLPGFYRVAAFFVLSVIMGAAAWGYQKIERLRRAAKAEGASHETA
jgi:uncharacterized membrane protein